MGAFRVKKIAIEQIPVGFSIPRGVKILQITKEHIEVNGRRSCPEQEWNTLPRGNTTGDRRELCERQAPCIRMECDWDYETVFQLHQVIRSLKVNTYSYQFREGERVWMFVYPMKNCDPFKYKAPEVQVIFRVILEAFRGKVACTVANQPKSL
eukprot:TRINITY_DN27961_c0_g1_i1.p1 TRINITY_DN27961_c0_g1~~TRINITY_DN27961_c0_g1_i1.p1  ORF type:complete len:153 (+),score=6.40 TRINITY_DN27961_c0_g1_i1:45-503(+)